MKEKLWQHLLESELLLLGGDEQGEPLPVIDSFPIPVCKKSRSYGRKTMRDLARRGRDTNPGKFSGMRAHVVIAWPGIIARANVRGANVSTTCTRPRGCSKAWGAVGSWPTGTVGPRRRWRSSCATEREAPPSWPASSGRTEPRRRGGWCGL